MTLVKQLVITLMAIALLLGCDQSSETSGQVNAFERKSLFNQDWYFYLTKPEEQHNFAAELFDHSEWRQLEVPHDWSIEQAFDEKYNGATAYLPGGIGWYRKTFETKQEHLNKQVFLYFDGVYANSEVWLNGEKLGGRINGYSPFYFDISAHLKPQNELNTLAVKVDHKNYIDSRWYTGSGIYRDVSLIVTDKLHIPVWGSFITTPNVSDEAADVAIELAVSNQHDSAKTFKLVTTVFDGDNQQVGQNSQDIELAAQTNTTSKSTITIDSPKRWDITSPHLYSAVHQIWQNNQLVDQLTTSFGIRTFNFDADKGFFLNGKNIKIKGVNFHHDAGLVGTAVPDDVWRRKLEKLKEAGVNAIRTAHNPVSTNFLKLCDELGLLVQAEIFDEWDNPKDKRLNQWERHSDEISRGYAEHFQTEAERDLKDSMLRDRNHPSIFMWSIGNEIEWTYPRYRPATGYFDMNASGNYFYNPPFISPEEIYKRFHDSEEGEYVLAKTAQKLSKWVKELDTSRPVTANLILPSVSHISGYADALDVVGYSYRRVIYDYGHELYPDKVIMGTENVVQWHEWKAIEERDFISGTFLWTGIDYLGEAHGAWPRKVTPSGMLDTAGFDKPSFHMYKTLWNEEPHVHITTQIEEKSLYKTVTDDAGNKAVAEKEPGKWQQRVWIWQDVNRHWNYSENEDIIVEVLSNCPEVELFLDDKSLGKEQLSNHPDRILKWSVPFKPGKLTAKGTNGCDASDAIASSGKATTVVVSTDKLTLLPEFHRVAHITIALMDDNGLPVTHNDEVVEVIVPENIELLGLDSGNSSTIEKYQTNKVKTYQGRALAIVRAKDSKRAEIRVRLADGGQQSLFIN